ncbi:MAG: hydrogenase expression/formation protein HypE [Gemmatimonadota bacterium]
MNDERIVLAHGGGGSLGHRLLDEVVRPELSNPVLEELADSAVVSFSGARLAFTTDSFVVKPLFFRGGDIGRLAVSGTVNDLAVSGAKALWLSLGLVIEEGFLIENLRRIMRSVHRTAGEAGVQVVCGDTKVVGRGEADGLFVSTSGIGVVPEGVKLSPASARPGDAVIVNGPLGEHGIAIMSEREGISFETPIISDVAPLGGLIETIFAAGAEIHVMRDPTRGGVASALNEIAASSGVTITLSEPDVPVSPVVAAACDMLGFDVLSVANEGKVLVVCPESSARQVLDAMQAHPLGREAKVIGSAGEPRGVGLVLKTSVGGQRIVDMPYGEALPRIC